MVRTQLHSQALTGLPSASNSPFLIRIKAKSQLKPSSPQLPSLPRRPRRSTRQAMGYSVKAIQTEKPLVLTEKEASELEILQIFPTGSSRSLIFGGVSVVAVLLIMGLDDQKSWALGPEGPLVEEFWDNMRRYALYALTVSTGALYTIFLPILELLKNPISAILVLTIIVGGIYIVSQVLSAMVGVSSFTYEYGY